MPEELYLHAKLWQKQPNFTKQIYFVLQLLSFYSYNDALAEE